jgi:hypothetical protein
VRNVLVLSTMEQIRGRAVDDKDKPAVIYFYNMTMGRCLSFSQLILKVLKLFCHPISILSPIWDMA